MKMFVEQSFEITDQIKAAFSKLRVSAFGIKGSYFHPLKGYKDLCALSLPGSNFKGRIILKHYGNSCYECVFIDNNHKYSQEFLHLLNTKQKSKNETVIFESDAQDNTVATLAKIYYANVMVF